VTHKLSELKKQDADITHAQRPPRQRLRSDGQSGN
jgi:hypothetical protein